MSGAPLAVTAPARYVTLAYGEGDAVYAQASMLLLSLLAHAPEPRELVVVTDHPERLEWLRDAVRIESISGALLERWRGPAPFSMRQKIHVAAAMMPASGTLVCLDADVMAMRDLQSFIDEVGAGARFMHTREYELGSSRRRGNRRLWQALEGQTFGSWRFRADDGMWNSGVVAVPATDEGLIQEALALYDAMAGAGIRHFATEQLVVGLVLERSGRLREAREWFTHYWGNKSIFTEEIQGRLRSARELGLTPEAAAAELRGNPIRLPAEARPGKWDKLKRWLNRGQPTFRVVT
ncbi:MAG TPA: hypothetical protein VNJ03_08885 [Vicinamibacterales bacterium]|nr:hypothetical protein [Vicinamibacterales bacterium]